MKCRTSGTSGSVTSFSGGHGTACEMQGRLPSCFTKTREEHQLRSSSLACPFGGCLACNVRDNLWLSSAIHSGRVASQVVGRQPTPHMLGFPASLLEALHGLTHFGTIGCFPAHLYMTPESFLLSILMSLTGFSLTVPESNGPDEGPFLMRVVPTFPH